MALVLLLVGASTWAQIHKDQQSSDLETKTEIEHATMQSEMAGIQRR